MTSPQDWGVVSDVKLGQFGGDAVVARLGSGHWTEFCKEIAWLLCTSTHAPINWLIDWLIYLGAGVRNLDSFQVEKRSTKTVFIVHDTNFERLTYTNRNLGDCFLGAPPPWTKFVAWFQCTPHFPTWCTSYHHRFVADPAHLSVK